jgi:hypothetical protein
VRNDRSSFPRLGDVNLVRTDDDLEAPEGEPADSGERGSGGEEPPVSRLGPAKLGLGLAGRSIRGLNFERLKDVENKPARHDPIRQEPLERA